MNRPIFCGYLGCILVMTFFCSCNQQPTVIPFPAKELQWAPPQTEPLQLTEIKTLKWKDLPPMSVKPVVQYFNLNQLTSTPYNPSDLKNINVVPKQVSFVYDQLPKKNLNINELENKPITFRTEVLPKPLISKTSNPSPQKNNDLALFDFSTLQGNPAKVITSVIQAKSGLLWIASFEGVFRYDGENLQTFIPGPLPFLVSTMVEDDEENIWINNANGLTRIDVKNGTLSFSKNICGKSNNLGLIYKDSKGFIWVYDKCNNGVSRIDPIALTYKSINTKTGLSDTIALQIVEDDEHKIWITTLEGGINIIDPLNNTIKVLDKSTGLSSNRVSAITKDSSGHIWAAMAGDSRGLNMIDLQKQIIYQDTDTTNKGYTFSLLFDKKGRLWRGQNTGLDIIDLERKKVRHLDQNKGLAGDAVLAFTADKDYRMWIATDRGMNLLDGNGDNTHLLEKTSINCLTTDYDGNIWAGTQKGVEILNLKTNRRQILNSKAGLTNDFIQCFLKFDNKILVATNGGVNIIDFSKKTIEKFSKARGLLNDTVYVAFKDKEGNIWLSGPRNGIDVYNPVNKTLRHTEPSLGLSDSVIMDIKQSSDGKIWVATNSGGVNIINLKTSTIQYLKNKPGLSDTCIRTLLPDAKGRMWIGTNKGVYITDYARGTITSIDENNG